MNIAKACGCFMVVNLLSLIPLFAEEMDISNAATFGGGRVEFA